MILILIYLANNQIKLKMIRSWTVLSSDSPFEDLSSTVNLDYSNGWSGDNLAH